MALQDLAIFLLGQSMKDLTKSGTDLTVEPLLSPFRDEDQVVLTIPF